MLRKLMMKKKMMMVMMPRTMRGRLHEGEDDGEDDAKDDQNILRRKRMRRMMTL